MSNKQPVAVFDIDGTLFRSGLYREVVYELIRMEALNENVLRKFSNQEQQWKKRAHGNAFAEFEEAMALAVDESLAEIKVSDFDVAAEQVVKSHKDNVYVYTRDLAYSLKEQGYYLIAISGSQTELVEPFAEEYGFDTWIGQHYERGEEYFTGRILQKTHTGKDELLKQLLEETGFELDGSVAVGDSKGDIAMLEMVEDAIAFNPESQLLECAMRNGWRVVIERKNMIYKLDRKGDEYVLAETDSH